MRRSAAARLTLPLDETRAQEMADLPPT